MPGKSINAVVVAYAPGAKSPEHQHAGSVFAYVLSGAIRSQNSAIGPARARGSEHLIGEMLEGLRPHPRGKIALSVDE